MANKITVNTDTMYNWATQLEAIADCLAEAKSNLSRVDTSDDWWHKVRMNHSVRLADNGETASLRNADQAVSKLSEILRDYDRRFQKLSAAVIKAGRSFENAENRISSTILGSDAGADAAVYGIGKATGVINPNSNEWSFIDSAADWIKDRTRESLEELYNKTVGRTAKLIDMTKNACEFYYNDYISKGTTYKVVHTMLAYGKITLAVAGATFAWLGTGAVTAGTMGAGGVVSIPAATLITMYSANEVANSYTDIYNLWHGDIEKVGQVNYLRDACIYSYGEIGKALGNEDLGEDIGKGLYAAGEVMTIVADVDSGMKGIGNAIDDAGTAGKLISNTTDTMKQVITAANTVDVKDLGKTITAIKGADAAMAVIKDTYNTVNGTYKIGKAVVSTAAE